MIDRDDDQIIGRPDDPANLDRPQASVLPLLEEAPPGLAPPKPWPRSTRCPSHQQDRGVEVHPREQAVQRALCRTERRNGPALPARLPIDVTRVVFVNGHFRADLSDDLKSQKGLVIDSLKHHLSTAR